MGNVPNLAMDAVAPLHRHRGGGGRQATAVLALLLGCVAVVALLGRTEPRGAALAERVPTSGPARADEASWKRTVLGLFGTFKAASGAGIDLVNPVDKDSFRGGGGGRIGPYRAPASSTPEGEVRRCLFVCARARVCVRTSTDRRARSLACCSCCPRPRRRKRNGTPRLLRCKTNSWRRTGRS